MSLMFKVWDVMRQRKVFVILESNDEHLYVNLILKASEKLKLDGSSLVLESDGTVVDDDDILKLLNKETLILLMKDQTWKSTELSSDLNLSTCSTATVRSDLIHPSQLTDEELPGSESSSRASSPSGNSSVSNSNTYTQVSEHSWNNFEIPWNTFSKAVLQDCEKGNRNYQTVTTVVHTVVDRIRDIKLHVSTKVFKIIANKIIDKYPTMFQDVDEDKVVLGDGSQTLTQKLIERNNYLNRPHKRKSLIQTHDISPKQKKKMLSSKAGCSNWQPENNGILKATLEENQNVLKGYASQVFITLDDKLKTLLEETYPIQRMYLNNPDPPFIDQIRDAWSILLKACGIYWHYEKLMGHPIQNLITVFHSKIAKILRFGLDKKYITTLPEDTTEKQIICLTIIAKFFNEDINCIIVSPKTEGENFSDTSTHNAPCMFYKPYSDDNSQFTVLLEKRLIDNFNNFEDAFKAMFALYYNFNLSYPKNTALTLEFVQRYMLKINPDQGTKGKKKGTRLLKLCSLMNNLKNIEA